MIQMSNASKLMRLVSINIMGLDSWITLANSLPTERHERVNIHIVPLQRGLQDQNTANT